MSSRVGHVQASTNPKSITPPVNPEAHEIPCSVSNLRVVPIEVRLLGDIQMKIIFAGFLVIIPGGACISTNVLQLSRK